MTEEPRQIRSRRPGADPAFPTGSDRSMDSRNWGLSKREHFAVLLMAGLNANPEFGSKSNGVLASLVIEQADELLASLAESDREVV